MTIDSDRAGGIALKVCGNRLHFRLLVAFDGRAVEIEVHGVRFEYLGVLVPTGMSGAGRNPGWRANWIWRFHDRSSGRHGGTIPRLSQYRFWQRRDVWLFGFAAGRRKYQGEGKNRH